MSDELLPCPFCGKHLVWEAPVAFVHPIGKCILSGRNFKKGPIQQWNRRAHQAPVDETRKEVMPVEATTNTRSATGPGVTAGAAPAEDVRAGALKEAADVASTMGCQAVAASILALIPGAKP